jgi:allantoate deiminase
MVPDAGAFDGPLGVMLGIGIVQLLGGRKLKFPIEVIGFSEEEGVRFGVPFIGSRALIGDADGALLARRDGNGVSVNDAIRDFGLEPAEINDAVISEPAAYLEFHIEQGPVLDTLALPLGVVETIVGQSRLQLQFMGHANHAGTTPMRRDALACAAEWIGVVEREAVATTDLVATVGRIDVTPGADNVIAGSATLSLDVRHPSDVVRSATVERLLGCASHIAARRGLTVTSAIRLDQPSTAMHARLVNMLADAVAGCGYPVHRMHSGAGHDAMILARKMPAAMLFLRSPGGISHHPDESVLVEDVAAALETGAHFIEALDRMEAGSK